MSKISINYPPSLIDEAIKEHVQRHMGITGNIEIEYTHRRRTRKVSAEVLVSPIGTMPVETPVPMPVETPVPVYSTQQAEKSISFDDLPEHEQQEATDQVALMQAAAEHNLSEAVGKPVTVSFEDDEESDSMFDDMPDQEGSEDESESEDLFA